MHRYARAWLPCGLQGRRVARPYFLALLAEAYGKAGQAEEGLTRVAEALTLVDKTGERFYEAELYRLKGRADAATVQRQVSSSVSPKHPRSRSRSVFSQGHRDCPQAASEVAGAAGGDEPGRLWQQQGKKTEAHQLLAEIYSWFTEGFDTKDLQEAKALLDELAAHLDVRGGRVKFSEIVDQASDLLQRKGRSPIGR